MKHRTFVLTKETAVRNWRIVNAEGQILGRLATQVATVLRGKDKPTFTPSMDGGDFVVVINAEKIKLTGKKLDKKKYAVYSGYRGGLKVQTARQLSEVKPEELIRLAVQGMIPHGSLGRDIMTKLKIYTGAAHPHEAQKPEVLQLIS